MIVQWTNKGLSDLVRLNEFLSPVNPMAAAKVVQTLTTAAGKLEKHPHIGECLEQFKPRDVRRFVVVHYEIRYEIRESALFILRLWHTRENR